jgi:hypothetical protein
MEWGEWVNKPGKMGEINLYSARCFYVRSARGTFTAFLLSKAGIEL